MTYRRPICLGLARRPSTTQINGRLVVRAAIVNDRIEAVGVDCLVDAVLAAGRERAAAAA